MHSIHIIVVYNRINRINKISKNLFEVVKGYAQKNLVPMFYLKELLKS